MRRLKLRVAGHVVFGCPKSNSDAVFPHQRSRQHPCEPLSGSQLGYHWTDWRKSGMSPTTSPNFSTS
jgi:hypothetical protein